MEPSTKATASDSLPNLHLHFDVELFLDGRKTYIEDPERKILLADDIAVGVFYASSSS